LLTELSQSIPHQLLPPGAIIEQEYQKTMAQHKLAIRPDIIIHEPFDAARHKSPRDGNIAVIELKLKANPAKAREDFESLVEMMRLLDYPVAVFINIGSQETHANLIPESAKGRITCFAVSLVAGEVRIIQAA
jgi:hypothetical protein